MYIRRYQDRQRTGHASAPQGRPVFLHTRSQVAGPRATQRLATVVSRQATDACVPHPSLAPPSFHPMLTTLAHTAFSPDGHYMFFTVCQDLNAYDKRCELWLSVIDRRNRWLPAIRLPEPINLPGYTNTQPSIGFDVGMAESQGKRDVRREPRL